MQIMYSWKLEHTSVVTKILKIFCQKIGKSRSCKKNNSGILDFVEKKIMRVFKCDVMYIEEIKLFLDTKPFFIFIM